LTIRVIISSINFCLPPRELLSRYKKEIIIIIMIIMALGFVLRLGYMDDITLVGSQDAVARDVQTIMDVGHEMGLDLNISKCEFVSHPGCVVSDHTAVIFADSSARRRTSRCFSVSRHCSGYSLVTAL